MVVELMNKIRKSHFVINLTNLFVNITKKIHYVNDAAFVDLTHLFVNPTKNFSKIFFLKLLFKYFYFKNFYLKTDILSFLKY